MTDLPYHLRFLVGEHERLYLTSAQFRHSVHLLAKLLPPMVDGLAARAESAEAERHERYAELLRAQPLRVLPAELAALLDRDNPG